MEAQIVPHNQVDQDQYIDNDLLPSSRRKNWRPRITIHRQLSLNGIEAGWMFSIVILFEILVCYYSASFYYMYFESNLFIATIMAVFGESIYMYSSRILNTKARVFRYAFLMISVTTITFAAVEKDSNVKTQKSNSRADIAQIQKKITVKNKTIEMLNRMDDATLATMSVYQKTAHVSKGLNRVNATLDKNNSKRNKIESEIKLLEKEKNTLRKAESRTFLQKVNLLNRGTQLMILIFAIFQMAVCFFLPTILNELGLSRKEIL